MARLLAIVSLLAACGSNSAAPAPSPAAPEAPAPVVEVRATEPPDEPPPVAAPAPVLVPAVRGWGPYASFCDGLPHVDIEGDVFEDALACDEEVEPIVREVLAAPEAPFDEARLVWAPALMPFHDEVGALLLAVRSGREWHLLVVMTDEGHDVGFGPTLSIESGGLHVDHSGGAARLTFRSTRAVRDEINWAGDEADERRPRRARSEASLVTCALAEHRLACASVPVASAGSRETAGGETLEAASWSVTATLQPADVIELSEPRGTAPDDLEIARPRQLVFDDAALTRARTLSNRCHRLRESGDLAGAEASCSAGLAERPTQDEHGALLYDVGRIAEARGDLVAARAAYTQSLAVRPGNAVVRARLDALPSD